MTATTTLDLRGNELRPELLDPRSVSLVRLFRHPKGDWDPPPPQYRNLRVDPPDGSKSAYAVLYTGVSVPVVAIECRILTVDSQDKYSWSSSLASSYEVVRYALEGPAIFLPIDGENLRVLERAGFTPSFGSYEHHQRLGLELFQRFGTVVHGLSWQSFHRNQPGRVYALWHHQKATVNLVKTTNPPYPKLADDAEWKAFLADHPEIRRIDP